MSPCVSWAIYSCCVWLWKGSRLETGMGSPPDMQYFRGIWQDRPFKIKRKMTVGSDRIGLMNQTEGCYSHMRVDVGHPPWHLILPQSYSQLLTSVGRHIGTLETPFPLLLHQGPSHTQFSGSRMSSVCSRDTLLAHTLAHVIATMPMLRVATPDH